MRKKQAKPTKRPNTTTFDDETPCAECPEFLDFDFEFSEPTKLICETTDSCNAAAAPLGLFPAAIRSENANGGGGDDGIACIKFSKQDPIDIPRCESGNCSHSSRSSTTDLESTEGHNSKPRESYLFSDIAYTTDVSHRDRDRKNLISFSTGKKSGKKSALSGNSPAIEPADSESPLKCLERCVRAKNALGCSSSAGHRPDRAAGGPSTSTAYSSRSELRGNAVKLRFGSDGCKTSAADALGELSQLVHRIGTAKLPVVKAPNKCIPNSVASNIFTCLKCAHRFDTLDELVLHISTTKHFSRGLAKSPDALAPWEKDRASVPQDLSRKSADKAASS